MNDETPACSASLTPHESADKYMGYLADAVMEDDGDHELVYRLLDSLAEDAAHPAVQAELGAYEFALHQAWDRGDVPPPVPRALWLAWRAACVEAGSGLPTMVSLTAPRSLVARAEAAGPLPIAVPGAATTADLPTCRPPLALPSPWLTLEQAAALVGHAPRSVLNRIAASGGKLVWSQCGRLPGKAPRFERTKFFEWWQSPANRPPRKGGKRLRKAGRRR